MMTQDHGANRKGSPTPRPSIGTGQQTVPEAVAPRLTPVSDISPPEKNPGRDSGQIRREKAVVDEIEDLTQQLHDALRLNLELQRKITDVQIEMVNPHHQLGDYVKASPIQRVLSRKADATQEEA